MNLELTSEEGYLLIYAANELANRRREQAVETDTKTKLGTEFRRVMVDESDRLHAIADRIRRNIKQSMIVVDCSHTKSRAKK